MSKLTATKFRVQNYRNIEDSDWIPLERVTALVGRNESGKTALLKALHKFNPATKEPYNPQREFPRARYTDEYSSDLPVCSVSFQLSDDFKTELAEIGGQGINEIICTRLYSGEMSVNSDQPIVNATITSAPLLTAFKTFSKTIRKFATPDQMQEEQMQQLRTKLLDWSNNSIESLNSLDDLRTTQGRSLLNELKSETTTQSHPLVADAIESLVEVLDKLIVEAKKPLARERFKELVLEALPVFIYFENYGILDSAIHLPRFNQDSNNDPHEPRVRTINAMFRHTKLDPKDLEELGNETVPQANDPQAVDEAIIKDRERKDKRAIDLNSASLSITDKFSKWWKQRRHTIEYQADGAYFRIWISDDRRSGVKIELESRSKGFQWFFSFYLVFLVESEDGHKDAVLLLDEPGTHLHPTAQQELIDFFEELSSRNPIVYSTHSPFLIDGKNVQRVRPITEDRCGKSHVSVGAWPEDRDTIFPLWAAAGYALMAGLLQQAKSVLVEGVSDYMYLSALSRECQKAGKSFLSDDISLSPCGGVTKIGPLASLFFSNKVRPIILLDGDQAGRGKSNELTREIYKNHERAVILLPEILGIKGAEIEDLLGEDIILPVLNQILSKKIQFTKEDRAKEGVVEHIEAAAKRLGIDLPQGWKANCAHRLVAAWSENSKVHISTEALDRAALIFSAITERFADSQLMKVV